MRRALGLAVFDRSALRAEAMGRCWSNGRFLALLADSQGTRQLSPKACTQVGHPVDDQQPPHREQILMKA
jgi:hypothetical protein